MIAGCERLVHVIRTAFTKPIKNRPHLGEILEMLKLLRTPTVISLGQRMHSCLCFGGEHPH